jgi:hypothetical protein
MPWTDIKLSDGRHIPGIGFGSSGHPKERCADDMVLALDSGFEHIDTAQSRSSLRQSSPEQDLISSLQERARSRGWTQAIPPT